MLAALRSGGRVWAVGAIHGEADRLRSLHCRLAAELRPGDQLVYLGGYLGHGAQVRETVDELLVFRRFFIAQPGVETEDVVFLRGAQEEMWQKLLQLQFASRPAEVLRWLIEHGVGATIAAYGGDPEQGLHAAEDGALSLTRWTSGLRQAVRQYDGHNALLSSLKHAALTDDGALLFVHAGLDPGMPLDTQRDYFWWGCPAFESLEGACHGFRAIVRGRAPNGPGLQFGPLVTLDAGCGQNGFLTAACFDADGRILHFIED